MTPEIQKLVSDVNVMVEDAIKRNLPLLTGIELVPSIRPPRASAGEYELCIEFIDSRGVADVIEFHVVRDGRPVADLPAIRQWFDESLADVIARAEAKIAATRTRI
jgi:hypothetical protein